MGMKTVNILWADDEIDLLKPHILFLEEKGCRVLPVISGQDAVAACREEDFDLIFLDEHMPGLGGLETLLEIKKIHPTVPVVMITKSEEEDLMEQAIGKQIADYLIKPVHPKQMLMAVKKLVHAQEIISEKTTLDYQSQFLALSNQTAMAQTPSDWQSLYRNLLYWELQLDEANPGMTNMLLSQKNEANACFAKFIKKDYSGWVFGSDNRPLLSPDIFKTKVFPLLDRGEKVFFVLIDNLRLDQWAMLQRELSKTFSFVEDETYYSILPTTTQYSRNAVFAGLMPAQIRQMYPQLWVDEEQDEGKNQNEEALIATQLNRFRKNYKFSYNKIADNTAGEKYNEKLKSLEANSLNIVVFNFVDMLSHARTEVKLFRDLAPDEAAYRSLVLSWFKHGCIAEFFRQLSEMHFTVVLTTDHGSVRVKNPVKVSGDKHTNSNLRYKLGKNLGYDKKDFFVVDRPADHGLPSPNLSTCYLFATGDDFIAYPNNYNYYVSYYRDTFQHGGVSMEEMIIPVATFKPKRP